MCISTKLLNTPTHVFFILKFYFVYLEEKYIILHNESCCMDIITINIFINWQNSSLLIHLSLPFHESNGASLT